MRLDKFLKISLIFKTRSSGEKAIIRKNVLLNGNPAKPSTKIKIGDTIDVLFLTKKIFYRIEAIAEKNVSRQEARTLYTITEEEEIDV